MGGIFCCPVCIADHRDGVFNSERRSSKKLLNLGLNIRYNKLSVDEDDFTIIKFKIYLT